VVVLKTNFSLLEVTLVVRRKYSYSGWRGVPAVYVVPAQYQDRREIILCVIRIEP
jgi:hypothetical protein